MEPYKVEIIQQGEWFIVWQFFHSTRFPGYSRAFQTLEQAESCASRVKGV